MTDPAFWLGLVLGVVVGAIMALAAIGVWWADAPSPNNPGMED